MRHGMSNSKLYKSWAAMKRRCDFPDEYHKKYYAGIRYYEEWKDFCSFRDWALANGYVDGYTIERIDIRKDYLPENCKWIPAKEQARNKRTSHFVTINGETKTIAEWCEKSGIKWTTFLARIKRGDTGERLLRGVDYHSHLA